MKKYLYQLKLDYFPCGWHGFGVDEVILERVKNFIKGLYQKYASRMNEIVEQGIKVEDLKEILIIERSLFMLVLEWSGSFEEYLLNFEEFERNLPESIPNKEFFDLYEDGTLYISEVDEILGHHRLFV